MQEDSFLAGPAGPAYSVAHAGASVTFVNTLDHNLPEQTWFLLEMLYC
jgi:hypothetical protein